MFDLRRVVLGAWYRPPCLFLPQLGQKIYKVAIYFKYQDVLGGVPYVPYIYHTVQFQGSLAKPARQNYLVLRRTCITALQNYFSVIMHILSWLLQLTTRRQTHNQSHFIQIARGVICISATHNSICLFLAYFDPKKYTLKLPTQQNFQYPFPAQKLPIPLYK